jgi:hypothetical protein
MSERYDVYRVADVVFVVPDKQHSRKRQPLKYLAPPIDTVEAGTGWEAIEIVARQKDLPPADLTAVESAEQSESKDE